MKYRKKPIVIEAWRYNGVLITDRTTPQWLLNAYTDDIIEYDDCGVLKIKTLEGKMAVSQGDYIIKGVNDELYPCKPDIFEKTYEAINED